MKQIKSYFIVSIALCTLLAIPIPAYAFFNTGYKTVAWMQVESTGNIAFRLNEETVVYYRCEGSQIASCRSILLTALSTNKEVKIFYGNNNDEGHSPTAGVTYVVHHMRIH